MIKKKKFSELTIREKIRVVIIFILFPIAFLFLLTNFSNFMSSFENKNYIADSSWVEIPGTISNESHAPRGRECAFDYEYNNQQFTDVASGGYDMHPYYAKIGDVFMLKVNPKSPEKYIPIVWRPVFLQHEKTNMVSGRILEVKKKEGPGFFLFRDFFHKSLDSPLSNYRVGYSYEISSQVFNEGQFLSPYLDSINGKIAVGQKFEVEYLVDNPQRAIIHVDRPIR